MARGLVTLRSILLPASLLVCAALARADDEGVAVAKKLAPQRSLSGPRRPRASRASRLEVTVFSGVSLGEGLIVTFSRPRTLGAIGSRCPAAPRPRGDCASRPLLRPQHPRDFAKRLARPGTGRRVARRRSTLYTAAAAASRSRWSRAGMLGRWIQVQRPELPPLFAVRRADDRNLARCRDGRSRRALLA